MAGRHCATDTAIPLTELLDREGVSPRAVSATQKLTGVTMRDPRTGRFFRLGSTEPPGFWGDLLSTPTLADLRWSA